MSQIDFVNLAAERPELAIAWAHLADWITRHPGVEIFDPRQVAYGSRGVSPIALAEAFMVLVDKGYLRQRFTVETPERTLAAEFFSSPSEIPDVVRDSLHREVDALHAPVVTVFTPIDGPHVEIA